MRLSLTFLVYLFFVAAAVNVHASFPKPFELSFSQEPRDSCNHPLQPKKILKSNVSLCFADLEDAAENVLSWRVMFTSFKLENKTAFVDLRIRRVIIFIPGASFTMAGDTPVSVFSRLRELEIGTHYNGFGEVSDPDNSSIIFKGQLNTTVFEGQIIYQSLNRSHTIQCFHNNKLGPDFYQDDDCLACIFTTYDTHHNPDSYVGWRSNGHSPCNNSSVDHSNQQDMFRAQAGVETDSKGEDSLGFPQTGFSDYNRNTPDQYVPHQRVGASKALEKEIRESVTPSAPTWNDIVGNESAETETNDNNATTYKNRSTKKTVRVTRDTNVLSSTKTFSDLHETASTQQFRRDAFSRIIHPVRQQTSRFPRSIYRKSASSGVSRSDKETHPRRRRFTKRRRKNQSTLRTARSAKPRPQSSETPSNHSYTETISCPLHLVADHLFFSEIGEKSPAKTVNLMLSVVIGADAVFRGTDFDGDGVRDNIGFMVKNITIIHNSSAAFYQYSRTDGNSFSYLKSFSTGDFSDVCLGVAFTAIDFHKGVVGLAWYATSLSGGAGKGGICGQRVYLPNEGSSFSFNTAIVSFLNYGVGVSMEKAILTMAHEFGHCFGSTHDDMADSPCNKAYPQGSYLMQTYRPSQYLPNNYKFSPCSLRQMYPVITLKGNCLLRYTGPTCGNGVVEEGEECDCGLSGACQFNDPCCTPGDAPLSSADPPCTVRRSLGLECSPVTFSCCSDSCKHIKLADRYVCREAGDCYSQASCDGQSPLCPASTLYQEGTLCHGGIRTCVQGRCRRSLCSRTGLEDCFCQDRPEDRCKLCCRRRRAGHDSRCQSAYVFNITSSLGHAIYLPEGDACLDYRGICTASQGKNKDKTFCLTTDGLDADFSALIGLRSDREDSGGAAWLDSFWLCFLLIPMVPALIAAALLCGRGVWVRFRNASKEKDKMADFYERKMLAFIAASRIQPDDVFRQETGKASALYDLTSSPRAFEHQRRFRLSQQRQHSKRSRYQYYGRRNQQETPESSMNRTVNTNSFPMYHSEKLSSPRKAGVDRQRGQQRLIQSLSVLESISSETSELPLPNYWDYKEQRPCKTVIPSEHPQRRLVNQNHIPFHKHHSSCSPFRIRHDYRHQKILGPSRRRLRATYSKPSARTPLQRRRTVPTEASSIGSTVNDRRPRHVVGDPRHLNRNSRVFFDHAKSKQNVYRHGSVHKPLSYKFSQST